MSEKEKKGTESTGKPSTKEKKATGNKSVETTKEKKVTGNNALKGVGLAACKRHKLDGVWVTTDGQAFRNENDARNHAKNLTNNEIIKVTAK